MKYRDYLNQIESLRRKAEAARRAELSSAIREARRLIIEFELTADDVGLGAGGSSAARRRGVPVKAESRANPLRGVKVPPKYRGPGGQLWTGRGRQPVWVREALASGHSLADLAL